MTDKQILSGWSDSEFSIHLGTPRKVSGHQRNIKVIKKHRTQLNNTSGVPSKGHEMPEESLLETPRKKRFIFYFLSNREIQYIDRKYRVLVSVVCLSVCLSVCL